MSGRAGVYVFEHILYAYIGQLLNSLPSLVTASGKMNILSMFWLRSPSRMPDTTCRWVRYHTDCGRRMVRQDIVGRASRISNWNGAQGGTQTLCDVAWLLSGVSLWTSLGSASAYCDHIRCGLRDGGILCFHTRICTAG